MAKSAVTECAAVFDFCRRRAPADRTHLGAGRELLLRIVSMLIPLIRRASTAQIRARARARNRRPYGMAVKSSMKTDDKGNGLPIAGDESGLRSDFAKADKVETISIVHPSRRSLSSAEKAPKTGEKAERRLTLCKKDSYTEKGTVKLDRAPENIRNQPMKK